MYSLQYKLQLLYETLRLLYEVFTQILFLYKCI